MGLKVLTVQSVVTMKYLKVSLFTQVFQAPVTSVDCKFTFSQNSRCRVVAFRRDFVL